jgi:hypothetical protein
MVFGMTLGTYTFVHVLFSLGDRLGIRRDARTAHRKTTRPLNGQRDRVRLSVRPPLTCAVEPGAHDYRQLVERKDLAAFETAPFEGDLRVVGW